MRADEIVQILVKFYNRGTIICAEDTLQISLDARTDELRLRSEGRPARVVAMSENAFVEFVRKANMPVDEKFVCLLLCVVYFDPSAFRFARED